MRWGSMAIKELFLDYKRNWSFGRIKELYKKGGDNPALYLTIYLPTMFFITIFHGEENFSRGDILFLVLLLAFMLVTFSILTHPVRLSKMYYLCPMTKEGRLRYVRNSYLFRIAIHMVLLLICYIMISLFMRFHPLYFLLFFINSLIYSSLILVDNTLESGSVYVLLLMPDSLFSALIELAACEEETLFNFYFIALIITTTIGCFLMLGFIKHIRRELNAAAYYDEGGRQG